MTLCQTLKGLTRVGHTKEIGIRIGGVAGGRHLRYHKVAYSPAIKLRNIMVSVVAFGLQSKEKRLLRKTKGAAVGEQKADRSVTPAVASCSDERCHFFDRISHFQLFFYLHCKSIKFLFAMERKTCFFSFHPTPTPATQSRASHKVPNHPNENFCRDIIDYNVITI